MSADTRREYYVYMKTSGRKVGEVMAMSAGEACRLCAQRNGYRVRDDNGNTVGTWAFIDGDAT